MLLLLSLVRLTTSISGERMVDPASFHTDRSSESRRIFPKNINNYVTFDGFSSTSSNVFLCLAQEAFPHFSFIAVQKMPARVIYGFRYFFPRQLLLRISYYVGLLGSQRVLMLAVQLYSLSYLYVREIAFYFSLILRNVAAN